MFQIDIGSIRTGYKMKSWRKLNLRAPYDVWGDDGDPRFRVLPLHDMSCLYTFVERNAAQFGDGWAAVIGSGVGTPVLVLKEAASFTGILAVEARRERLHDLAETLRLNGIEGIELAGGYVSATGDAISLSVLLNQHPDLDLVFISPPSASSVEIVRSADGLLLAPGPPVVVLMNPDLLVEDGVDLADYLLTMESHLGPLGLIDELTGMVSLLSSGGEGERQLMALRRAGEIFGLVSQPNLFEVKGRPQWRDQEQARTQRSAGAVDSQGIVVDDRDVAVNYLGSRLENIPYLPWSGASGLQMQSVVSFRVPGLIVTSCYMSIDEDRRCLFLNQTYDRATDWFNTRPRISNGGYEFSSRSVLGLEGRYVVIGGPIDGVYYHWLLNWCPRITLFKSLQPDLYHDHNTKFLIDRRAQEEPFSGFLKALGVDASRIYFSNDDVDYQLEEGILTPFLSQSGYYPSVMERFREEVLQGLGVPQSPSHHPRRVFIDRQILPAAKRRVHNYDEISCVLGEFGIISVALERLSLSDQALLFYNAELVVGVHGAGLANLLFAKSECRALIIESARNIETGISRMFSTLAEMRGQSTVVLPVLEHIDPDTDYSHFSAVHNRDVIVDPQALRASLTLLLA